MNGAEQESLVKKLNPILQGFANYYKGVVSKDAFNPHSAPPSVTPQENRYI
jgi:hypothetical protein